MYKATAKRLGVLSRPVWGAWIEIRITGKSVLLAKVAPRMGRVD